MNTFKPPQLGDEGSILEGIVTTHNVDGSVNVAPMGPIVDRDFCTWVFRPFRSSTTYRNLKREASGVFHITDDVMLIAEAAVGQLKVPPQFIEHHPLVLKNCCRWYEFQVDSMDDRDERTRMVGRTTRMERVRDFFGFNRAKHAVLEAAILATRLHILPPDQISAEMKRLQTIVDKTGSASEHQAFAFLQNFVDQTVDLSACKDPIIR